MTLGFNNQILSKENSIKVEWAPSNAPSDAMLQSPPTPALIEEDGVLNEKKSKILEGRKLARMFSQTPLTTPAV